jgi:D-glycero-D-manno-heptose 1,7-bisphosphate phosphatase
MRPRFVMLDRDGTLIEERHYLSRPDQVVLLPGVVEGLRALRQMGLGLVVLTNQSGIGRGLFDLDALRSIHERMATLLGAQGLALDGIYYCPHRPDEGCPCRKPATGMAMQAATELGFDPGEGFMVGDKAVDVDLGRNLGAKTVLVLTGYGRQENEAGRAKPDHVVEDLSALPAVIAPYLADKTGRRA